jgi:DNA polymerase delta subunit 3
VHGLNEIDDEMPDVSTAPDGPSQDESPPPPPPEKQAELKEEITSHGGRRRGRRQVMKKKTIKDEEGYLGILPIYRCLSPLSVMKE